MTQQEWDVTLGQRPTEDENGEFDGRETRLGVCDCPCNQPTSYYVDDGEWCIEQTTALRAEAKGVTPDEYLEAQLMGPDLLDVLLAMAMMDGDNMPEFGMGIIGIEVVVGNDGDEMPEWLRED